MGSLKKALCIKRQILQVGLLIGGISMINMLIKYVDKKSFTISMISVKLNEDTPTYIWKLIFLSVCFITLLYAIRRSNKDKKFVSNEIYGAYPFWIYWFSSYILGIKTCSLVLVPIYMQYKLLLRGVFINYEVGDEINSIDDAVIKPYSINRGNKSSYVNLVISDTYKIDQKQLPKNSLDEYSVFLFRKEESAIRVYNQEFLNQIAHIVKLLPKHIDTINLFCTTNSSHNKWLANNVFLTADRSNIKHLNIYQQDNVEPRCFVKRVKVK